MIRVQVDDISDGHSWFLRERHGTQVGPAPAMSKIDIYENREDVRNRCEDLFQILLFTYGTHVSSPLAEQDSWVVNVVLLKKGLAF